MKMFAKSFIVLANLISILLSTDI